LTRLATAVSNRAGSFPKASNAKAAGTPLRFSEPTVITALLAQLERPRLMKTAAAVSRRT